MLSNREVEQYRELGYLVVPDVLDAPLLAEVRRMVDGIVADAPRLQRIPRSMILKTHILPSNRGCGASRHHTSIFPSSPS